MKKVLLKDIVIPAGTLFSKSPLRKELIGDGHYEHVLGLTNDSSGDISYYIDPDDPALDEWFIDMDPDWKIVTGDDGKIISFAEIGISQLDMPSVLILNKAIEANIDKVVVAGYDEEGEFYFASAVADGGEILWLWEALKRKLLNNAMGLVGGYEEEPTAIATNPKMATITDMKPNNKPGQTEHRMIIEPAIPVKERHIIEKALESLGYNVWAGGTCTDGSSCDISFEKDKE